MRALLLNSQYSHSQKTYAGSQSFCTGIDVCIDQGADINMDKIYQSLLFGESESKEAEASQKSKLDYAEQQNSNSTDGSQIIKPSERPPMQPKSESQDSDTILVASELRIYQKEDDVGYHSKLGESSQLNGPLPRSLSTLKDADNLAKEYLIPTISCKTPQTEQQEEQQKPPSKKPYLCSATQVSTAANHEQANLRIQLGRLAVQSYLYCSGLDAQTARTTWGHRILAIYKHHTHAQGQYLQTADLCQRAVCIYGIHPNVMNVKKLCNLLSNYGNICFGMYFKEANFAFVMYECQQGAQNGIHYLQNMRWLRKWLQICPWSHFDGLDPCYLFAYPGIYVPPIGHRRFKQGIPKKANSVSATLHICIFYPARRRVVSSNDILSFLRKAGYDPLEIRRDSNPENQNMWFVDFKKLSDSILALMTCHDSQFEDGNIRISFTKSRRALQERDKCSRRAAHL
jgi:hypothetical protein